MIVNNQLRNPAIFHPTQFVLSLRLMHCFANARQCVGGLRSDLLTFLQPWTELFWDFSFNVKRTIPLRMSSSQKYFSGVRYCKNKISWMCSKAFKWTMHNVTRACAYYLCKIQGFPDTETRKFPEEACGEWKRRPFSQRSVRNTAEKWKTAWKSD